MGKRDGLFSRLLRRFKPLEIDDPFFGRLVYMKISGPGISYWESERQFSPCSRQVELLIDAPGPKLPPNEDQREFFNWVEQNYAEILKSIESVARPAMEDLMRKPLMAKYSDVIGQPFSSAFHLDSFSIPVPRAGVAPKWEMSFESNSDVGFLVTVELIGADPQPDISIDFC